MTSLRYALRSLAKSPVFVAISVLALGVGLGISTTMFAVLDAVLNPHVPYRDPGNLFHVGWRLAARMPVSSGDVYRFLRDNGTVFEGVVPTASSQGILDRGGADPREITVSRVTPRYFTLFGLQPRLGRLFDDREAQVVLLGEDLWRHYFSTRGRLDGATINIDGQSHRVIGVIPRGAGTARVWVPLDPGVETGSPATLYISTIARLPTTSSRAEHYRRIQELSAQFSARIGAPPDAPASFWLQSLSRQPDELRQVHTALTGAALLVLLIACVNIAHLMMARGIAKRREMALRMALGASRGVIVQQMFVEALAIALGGATVGGLLAVWGSDLLGARMPDEVSWLGLLRPQLSWRVFGGAALAAAASTLIFGLLPALSVTRRISLDEPLKDNAGTTTGRTRYRYNPLVMTEVALTLVLTVGGALLIRTVQEIRRAAPDVETATLYRAQLQVAKPTRRWQATLRVAPSTIPPNREAILTTARAITGIREAAVSASSIPTSVMVTAEGGSDSVRTLPLRSYRLVTLAYFSTLGLPVLRGRDFAPGDDAGVGVAIIDALSEARLYPGQNAVGRMIKLGSPISNAPWLRVVGVVRSMSDPAAQSLWGYAVDQHGLGERVPMVYVYRNDPQAIEEVIIRTGARDPAAALALQARLRGMPMVIWAQVRSFDYVREAELASRTFLADVFVSMALVALALAILGLYAVLAYAVDRRLREYAIRVALGAEARMLRKQVLYEAMVMLLGGIGAGAFIALAAAWSLNSLLVGVTPSDVLSLVVCEAIVVGIGLAAALAPARRAARANPLDILRAS